jgi:hypothetical protein
MCARLRGIPRESPKPWISLKGDGDLFSGDDKTTVRIKVAPSSYKFAEFITPAITGFLGSLLTLPGLLAFREARRRRSQENSRIVVAGDIPKNPQTGGLR